MRIVFSRHAREKFEVLARHGWNIPEELVEIAIRDPDCLDESRHPLLIAQTTLDATHVLRVVYRQREEEIFIITFYPGRASQYGGS